MTLQEGKMESLSLDGDTDKQVVSRLSFGQSVSPSRRMIRHFNLFLLLPGFALKLQRSVLTIKL